MCNFITMDIISRVDPHMYSNTWIFSVVILCVFMTNWFAVGIYTDMLFVWIIGLICTLVFAIVLWVGRKFLSRGMDKLRIFINDKFFNIQRVVSMDRYHAVDLYETYYNRSMPYAYVYQGVVACEIRTRLLYLYINQDMSKEGNRNRALFEAKNMVNEYLNGNLISQEVLFNTVSAVSWEIISYRNRERFAFGNDDVFPRSSFD